MTLQAPLTVIRRIRSSGKILQQLSKYGFGRKPMKSVDFRKICHDENILVLRRRTIIEGAHCKIKNGPCFILIQRGLNEERFLEVAFHELGHHFLHTGYPLENALWTKKRMQRQEDEADAFAILALDPPA
jgi:Zn-dependent peptidase ImmA (M78 family)